MEEWRMENGEWNEQDWANRFSRDVDGLLNEAGRTDSKPLPTEYRQALDLARMLATTDLSDESQVRHTLRRRLLNRVGVREGGQLRKEYVMRTFFRKRFQVGRGLTMKKGFVLATIAALILAALSVVVVAFLPSVQAQMIKVLPFPFGYVQDDDGARRWIPDTDFMQPTYLPAEFVRSFGEAKLDPVRLVYWGQGEFLDLTQSKAHADRILPAGREVTINGQPAVLVTGLEGTFEFGPGIPSEKVTVQVIGTPPARPLPRFSIAYTDGRRLIWYVGDVKVEMLSNLPEEEMLKVAASLAPWE